MDSNKELTLKSRERWISFFNHLFTDSDEMWNLYSISSRLILALNPKSIASTGYTLDELKITPIERIYPESELLKLGAVFQNLKSQFISKDDLRFFTKSGNLKEVTIRASLLSEEPELICLVKTAERKT